jgi:hypothetical protein
MVGFVQASDVPAGDAAEHLNFDEARRRPCVQDRIDNPSRTPRLMNTMHIQFRLADLQALQSIIKWPTCILVDLVHASSSNSTRLKPN